jgi:hypothetical protein
LGRHNPAKEEWLQKIAPQNQDKEEISQGVLADQWDGGLENPLSFFFSLGREPLFYYFSFINMCIQCLGNFSPLSPTPSLTYPAPSLSPHSLSLPDRKYFGIISNFVEERV